MSTQNLKPLHAGTLHRLLKQRSYFKQLPDDIFRKAEGHAYELCDPSSNTILKEGDVSPFAWFLVKGEVTLQRKGHADRLIRADSPDAEFPLANLRPSHYTVKTGLDAMLVRMEQSFLRESRLKSPPARFLTDSEGGGGSWQSHPFAIEVARLIQQGNVQIPALPGISLKISEAMQDPNFDLEDLARIISADPAIAGQLISIANSALFRGQAACQTLHAAIVRLGVSQTRTLVTSLAAKALFTGRQPWLREVMQAQWRHAVDMACYATVLARLSNTFDQSRAMLMGLLHEIGKVPVLQLAASYGALAQAPGILQATLDNLSTELTTLTLLDWSIVHGLSTLWLDGHLRYFGDQSVELITEQVTSVLIAALRGRIRTKDPA